MTTDDDSARSRRSEEPIRLRTPEQPSILPDWMLDPPPARRRLGTRVADGLAVLPGAGQVRRHWWAWQRRQRLYQRYPNTVKILAMVVSFVTALALVLSVYGLLSQV